MYPFVDADTDSRRSSAFLGPGDLGALCRGDGVAVRGAMPPGVSGGQDVLYPGHMSGEAMPHVLVLLSLTACTAGSFTGTEPEALAIPGLEAEALLIVEALHLLGDDPWSLRTTGFGRPGQVEPVSTTTPALGDCLYALAGACDRRIELDRGDLVEWFAAAPGGVEQGWEIAAPPPGQGPVLLEVGLEGAFAEGEGEALTLRTDAGGRWLYDGLAAWDAAGRALPARLVGLGDQIRIDVDVEGAIWPVVVDPLIGTAPDLIDGGTTNGYFGYSVSSVGDVNGDGYDDILVGERGYGSGIGRAYVFHGSSTGIAAISASSANTIITGDSTATSYFGGTVTGAGDVNGDGYDDALVSAQSLTTAGGSDAGAVYLFLGSASGISATTCADASATIEGTWTRAWLGKEMSGGSDVNGDGYDDIALSAYSASSKRPLPHVYLFLGGAAGITATDTTAADAAIGGEDWDSYFGSSHAFGDINGDGYADLAVGASKYDTFAGRVYVFHGSSTGIAVSLAVDADTIIDGLMGNYLGRRITASDITGDGYDDLVVSAPNFRARVGKIYGFHGSSSGVTASSYADADWTISRGADTIGFQVIPHAVGDLDGDGYQDFLAANYDHASQKGRVYVFHGTALGSTAGISTNADAIQDGFSAGDLFGYAAASAGDLDGNGHPDLVIGSYGYSSNTGRIYVYYGP